MREYSVLFQKSLKSVEERAIITIKKQSAYCTASRNERRRMDYNMGKFVVKETKTGIKFDLCAGNGEVIATSEVYSAEKSCLNGIASVRKNCVGAVEDQTVEGYETVKHPKFEVYTDKSGEYRFRLKATNGEVIAVSEGYKSKASCLNGIESVKKNAPDAKVVKDEKNA